MGPARLLAEREGEAGKGGHGERAAGDARAPTEQHEVERHQREPGGGVGTRIAARARQFVRAVAEQGNVRPAAAIKFEITRTIDIGDLLEPRDDGRAQHERRSDEGSAALQRSQPRDAQSGDRRDDRGQADDAHQPAAARVDEAHCPPGVCADPGLGGRVVEERACNAPVDGTGDREGGRDEQAGHEGPPEPGQQHDLERATARAHHRLRASVAGICGRPDGW